MQSCCAVQTTCGRHTFLQVKSHPKSHSCVIRMSSARRLHIVHTRFQPQKYFQLNSRATALLKIKNITLSMTGVPIKSSVRRNVSEPRWLLKASTLEFAGILCTFTTKLDVCFLKVTVLFFGIEDSIISAILLRMSIST